ncbi:hypothetical protein OAL42_00135 [Akkermansiaceae bacterium]|nr:hypothetical protein [Akkermansiaceae bacterium]
MNDLRFYIKTHGLIDSVFNQGLWSLLVYRFGRSLYGKSIYKLFLIWYFYLLLKNLLVIITKIEMPASAKIGKHANLVHAYGLVLGNRVEIGDNVTIGPWVVVGHNGVRAEQPTIASNCYIGAKASILGNIIVGEGSVVGPNTVLTTTLGPSSIAKTSFCQILDR